MKYSEMLKDPEWQKKRLQILERDNWKCQTCGNTKATLHVHHMRYIKGHKPREYENEFLITLCAECHEEETNNAFNASCDLGSMVRDKFLSDSIHKIATGFLHLENFHKQDVMASVIKFMLSDNLCITMATQRYFEKKQEESCHE